MGLTVQYSISLNNRRRDLARKKIAAMREIALDLGFDHVGEIVEYTKEQLAEVSADDRWMATKSGTSVNIPWTQHKDGGSSRSVDADWFVGFTCCPGDGCESLDISLSEYPRTIEVDYKPEDDVRFQKTGTEFCWFGANKFDWTKWRRWCVKNDRNDLLVNGVFNPCRLYETRTLKVPYSAKIGGGSFCKTQYASQFGGHHFVRCHLSVCHLLRKIGNMPGVTVDINDEGHYETATYSDDWQEAHAAGRKPTYVPHDATYSVQELLKQCGEYNVLVATMVGAFTDAMGAGGQIEAPIVGFVNWEQLEAAGQDQDNLQPMLEALRSMSKREVVEAE